MTLFKRIKAFVKGLEVGVVETLDDTSREMKIAHDQINRKNTHIQQVIQHITVTGVTPGLNKSEMLEELKEEERRNSPGIPLVTGLDRVIKAVYSDFNWNLVKTASEYIHNCESFLGECKEFHEYLVKTTQETSSIDFNKWILESKIIQWTQELITRRIGMETAVAFAALYTGAEYEIQNERRGIPGPHQPDPYNLPFDEFFKKAKQAKTKVSSLATEINEIKKIGGLANETKYALIGQINILMDLIEDYLGSCQILVSRAEEVLPITENEDMKIEKATICLNLDVCISQVECAIYRLEDAISNTYAFIRDHRTNPIFKK